MGTKFHPETINRLHQEAITLQSKGRFQESLHPLKKIVTHIPHHFPAWHALGNAWKKLRKPKESLACLEQSLVNCPEYYPAAISLATLLYEDMGQIQEGEKILLNLLKHHPELPELYLRLSDVYSRKDNFDKAQTYLKKFIHHQTQADDQLKVPVQLFDYQLVADLHIDPLLLSHDHEQEELSKLSQKLDHFLSHATPLKGIPAMLPFSPFYLAYYQTNPRPYLEKIASLYRQAYPDLGWVSPHLHRKGTPSGKIKIGLVSSYLDKFHPIGFCFSSLIKAFDRDKFSLTYFRLPVHSDDFVFVNMKEQLGKIRCIDLPENTIDARALIAEQNMDILWYTDIAMVAQTYFLAHARLAPIQCVSAGHPMTTGLATIDYFISSQWLEGDKAQDHYIEQVLTLPTLPVIYEDFPYSKETHHRSHFGLPQEGRIYFCCQTLFKVHPAMDEVFKKILEQDSQGWIVFSYQGTALAEQLHRRLQQTLGSLSTRCVFIPRVHQHSFFDLLQEADVLLDTFPFSGGNTAFQGLAMGIPIVTMDTQELRGTSTKALYAMMEMDEGVAKTSTEYAEKCLHIAQNPDVRNQIRQKILDRKHLLFSQKEQVIEAYEHAFQGMIDTQNPVRDS